MEGSNRNANFSDKKTNLWSSEFILLCDMNDPDKNWFSYQVQEIDSP